MIRDELGEQVADVIWAWGVGRVSIGKSIGKLQWRSEAKQTLQGVTELSVDPCCSWRVSIYVRRLRVQIFRSFICCQEYSKIVVEDVRAFVICEGLLLEAHVRMINFVG